MKKEVVIIGGGVIGLCCAYYLQKEGCKVTVLDQSDMNSGASYVNAGYLSPSHIIPLASPGMVKTGLKWMLKPSSPFYIKPRLNASFLKWAFAFNKSCSHKNVVKAIPAIKDITLLSQKLYDEIKLEENFTFHYEKKGLLMLCNTDKGLESEIKIAKKASSVGFNVKTLSATQVQKLEPNLEMDVVGATFYEQDYHTTPLEFMAEMKNYLQNAGVKLIKNEKVEDINFLNNKILAVKTREKSYKADEFILTSGAWSSALSKKIGINLLLQAGKGYCINSPKTTSILYPAILTESKVAVTPMNGFTRFAGTMEIAKINNNINKIRVNAIAESVSKYYKNIHVNNKEKANASCGLRPLSPDGLPYVGKSKKCSNLTIATGHAMLGWSMATATGKIVSEIIGEKKLSLHINTFHPDRKF